MLSLVTGGIDEEEPELDRSFDTKEPDAELDLVKAGGEKPIVVERGLARGDVGGEGEGDGVRVCERDMGEGEPERTRSGLGEDADEDRGLPEGVRSGLEKIIDMFLTSVCVGGGDVGEGGPEGFGRKAARTLLFRVLAVLIRGGGGLCVDKACSDCFIVSTDGKGVLGSFGISPRVGGELEGLLLVELEGDSNARRLNPREILLGAGLGVEGEETPAPVALDRDDLGDVGSDFIGGDGRTGAECVDLWVGACLPIGFEGEEVGVLIIPDFEDILVVPSSTFVSASLLLGEGLVGNSCRDISLGDW